MDYFTRVTVCRSFTSVTIAKSRDRKQHGGARCDAQTNGDREQEPGVRGGDPRCAVQPHRSILCQAGHPEPPYQRLFQGESLPGAGTMMQAMVGCPKVLVGLRILSYTEIVTIAR